VADSRPNVAVSCSDCKASVDEPAGIEEREPCPSCGSLARTVGVTLTSTVQIRTLLDMKGRHQGETRPFVESKQGNELFQATGEWRTVRRVVDREHDRYTEHITDAAGNVVRDVDEPLSQHRGHGAAKRRPSHQPDQ